MGAEGQSWQDKARAKLESINESIPQQWRVGPIPSVEQQSDVTGDFVRQYLTPEEIEITETDAAGIVKKTTTGQWTAEETIKAFCHRASIAHQLTSCLHETFFGAAIEEAKALDHYYAKHKCPSGPLHGLPVSLKDQFHVRGVETTMGYVGWIGTFQGATGTGKEKTYESEMVQELRSLGAVLYVKTSVPHTLMCGETINNIIGYTQNPKNRNLSSGGSSGGEGALIGLRGSPIGFGTDIGGSIRIPAAFNGLYGIRPSSGRLPYEGMANSMDGQNSILSVVGPLATSVASLRLVIKAILSRQPWLHDPLVHEIPWRDEQEEQIVKKLSARSTPAPQLAFGILKNDGITTPHPPVQRAMDIVAKAITQLGHKLTTWEYDGGADIRRAFDLSGEPVAPQIAGLYSKRKDEMTASQIAAVNIAKREYQKEYLDYWNSTEELTGTGRPVDAFISPVAPFAAARPGKYIEYGYTLVVNVLDYTSCTIPVTVADKRIDVADTEFKPLSNRDQATADTYDPEIYDGAHVSVQIIGRRLQEEKVLTLAEHIGASLKPNVKPSL